MRFSGRARTLSIAASLAAVFTINIRSNDSMVTVEAGGLVLTKTEAISMESERLEISMSDIHVVYRFRNLGDRDITTRVAFPIPEFEYDDMRDYNMDLGSDNPFQFEVTVEGVAVAFKTERVLKGQRLSYIHHWEQRFPARQAITVEHRYRPGVGFMFWIPPKFQNDYPDFLISMSREYCAPVRQVNRWAKTPEDLPAAVNPLHYLLTTANNWSGPIRDFTLVVKFDDPGVFLFSCFPGLRRRKDGTYRVHRKNFRPSSELKLLFLRSMQESRAN